MRAEEFFAFARARHQIYLDRAAGLPRPWTDDPILANYKFTNVFRELDRTTVWFRENVRDPLRDKPEVLLATVLFRWFNRITTGEAIFLKQMMNYDSGEGETAWDVFLRTGDTGILRAAIVQYCAGMPVVTGAYIIKSPDGMSKLDGVLQCVEWSHRGHGKTTEYLPVMLPATMAETQIAEPNKQALENLHRYLCKFPFMGPFMAYEVVTDLRHTAIMEHARDINSWANPGPGAMRGLNRMHGRALRAKTDSYQLIEEMRVLLAIFPDHWPSEWPIWEMREVEHTLCEWDKYERARLGQGQPRNVYR